MEGVRAWREAAFGDEVVDHYANRPPVELAAFDAAVTDWERAGASSACDRARDMSTA